MENDSVCMSRLLHEKNDFAKVSKSLAIDLKIILLDRQNNFSRDLNHNEQYIRKRFDILTTSSKTVLM